MIKKKDKDGNVTNVEYKDVPTPALLMVLIEAVLEGKLAGSELMMARVAMERNKNLRVDLNAQARLKEVESKKHQAALEIQNILDELDNRFDN
jgi:hypothetical protein